MKKLLLAALALSSSVWADDIAGAFGLTLGQQADMSALTTLKLENEYTIDPPSPNPMFSHYSVAVTPVSKKYFIISATKVEPNNCAGKAAGLAEALEKKYEVKAEELKEELRVSYKISKSDNDIYITCENNLLNYSLSIYYMSNKLQKQADEEMREQTSNKADTSTL